MKTRFEKLWNQINACCCAEIEFLRLEKLYAQSHRFYHNFEHIRSCLCEIDAVSEKLNHPDIVEFAIWYHDAVYDTNVSDNEQQSALLATDVCKQAGLSEFFVSSVKVMIFATMHNGETSDTDAAFMVDADLAILGSQKEKFDQYENNIRKEYRWVAEDIFKLKRSEILNQFLERDSIYATEFFRDKYEAQARENLKRSLNALME